MSGRRIAGLVLLIAGIAVLALGGVFWTDRDTLVDAGPVQITREDRQGVSIPPAVGIAAIVGGAILLLVPGRQRA